MCKNVFGIGKGEADALVNLVLHVPGDSVELLQAAATKHGMWHGPFTHSALASNFLALDAHVDTGEAEWNALMKNETQRRSI